MRTRLKLAVGLALAWGAMTAPGLAAPAHDVRIDDVNVYPESIGATPDGTIYSGSMKGIVLRARRGQPRRRHRPPGQGQPNGQLQSRPH